MKLKLCIMLTITFIVISSFNAMASNNAASLFDEAQALSMIFNNYDSTHQISIWENMKFPREKEIIFFWRKKIGIVSNVLFQSYEENGKEKIFLLTKTIPVGIPFECHACLPLLSAAVFVFLKGHWQIESKNLFLMYEGEYGVSPKAKLVLMKNNKYGVLLEFEHRGDGVSKEKALIMPRGSRIEVLYHV